MKRAHHSSNLSFVRLIWANIVRQQYLQGITDEQLCEVLGVTTRTLFNYRHDASNLTLQQLQAVIESFGLEPEALLRT